MKGKASRKGVNHLNSGPLPPPPHQPTSVTITGLQGAASCNCFLDVRDGQKKTANFLWLWPSTNATNNSAVAEQKNEISCGTWFKRKCPHSRFAELSAACCAVYAVVVMLPWFLLSHGGRWLWHSSPSFSTLLTTACCDTCHRWTFCAALKLRNVNLYGKIIYLCSIT